MAEKCVQGAQNEQRIIALERDIGEVKTDIHDMKEGLLCRPSWAVCMLITILSSVSVAALTFAFTVYTVVSKMFEQLQHLVR